MLKLQKIDYFQNRLR